MRHLRRDEVLFEIVDQKGRGGGATPLPRQCQHPWPSWYLSMGERLLMEEAGRCFGWDTHEFDIIWPDCANKLVMSCLGIPVKIAQRGEGVLGKRMRLPALPILSEKGRAAESLVIGHTQGK